MHVIDLICVLISSYKLIDIIKHKRNEAYEDHKVSIIFFTSLICFSIILRIGWSFNILSFDFKSIAIYSIIELIILLGFSIFKKDEDGFACFNRSN